MIKAVFFGTHHFALHVLKQILGNKFKILAAVTAADAPQGRGLKKTMPPVKAWLISNQSEIKILQPANLKDPLVGAELKKLKADVFIVVEYGLLIPKKIFSIPNYGTVNIHPSILPEYRGASPLESAVMDGKNETGVTLMLIDEMLDHGPIISQKKIEIKNDEMIADLKIKAADAGTELLIHSLPKYVSGEIEPIPQNDAQATFCKELKRESGKINFQNSAEKIYNSYRALTPWPGIYAHLDGTRIKLLAISPAKETNEQLAPGHILIKNRVLLVGTGTYPIQIMKLQKEGKKPLNAADFINGIQDLDKKKFS